MSALSLDEITRAAIAEEKEKLSATRERVKELTAQVAELQVELERAREEEERLSGSVRWRELMAAVNADDDVYGITERLTETFAAFRESLKEPENYVQSQRDDAKAEEAIVPFSDTDDYADFSAVEAAVEDVLAVAKESLQTHAADPLMRSAHRSSLTESFAQRALSTRAASSATESEAVRASMAVARRRALLQLLVLTVLMGKVEEHCSFDSIHDPSCAPQTDAEELRDGVSSTWQWLFYEQPALLTAEERAEWLNIATTYLGEAYTAAP